MTELVKLREDTIQRTIDGLLRFVAADGEVILREETVEGDWYLAEAFTRLAHVDGLQVVHEDGKYTLGRK